MPPFLYRCLQHTGKKVQAWAADDRADESLRYISSGVPCVRPGASGQPKAERVTHQHSYPMPIIAAPRKAAMRSALYLLASPCPAYG